jgi:uncharacterized RmlC-like cupin family protein
MAEFKVIRADEGEVEVSSGPLTRVAGISQGLTGAQGIHMAIGSVPPGSKSTPPRISTARPLFTSSEATVGSL